jgi:hypothetical protein
MPRNIGAAQGWQRTGLHAICGWSLLRAKKSPVRGVSFQISFTFYVFGPLFLSFSPDFSPRSSAPSPVVCGSPSAHPPRSIYCTIIPAFSAVVASETKESVVCCKHFCACATKYFCLQIQMFSAALMFLIVCFGVQSDKCSITFSVCAWLEVQHLVARELAPRSRQWPPTLALPWKGGLANQTIGMSNRKIMPNRTYNSFTASVEACCWITRSA